ncbi:MAG: hypothetical protein Q9M50_02110 [Methylococcales bacterium]|nr:hypothetical protein [Methylococcales bacterium]
MKKSKILLPLLALLMSASFAQAAEDIKLEDNSSILGKWKLNYESPALHKEKKKVNIRWNFKKDGTILTSATDTRSRTGKMSIKLKYSVEEGVIKKQSTPGREKYETCRVVQQEKNSMVLKCKYLFFFLERE